MSTAKSKEEASDRLMDTVREVHSQHADDLCWMDIDKIFAAAGLPVPDRSVGDPVAMHSNCWRFITQLCTGKKDWPSYAQLEARIKELEEAIGVCVPTALRCFIKVSKERGYDVDVEITEKVLARVNKAMGAT